MQSKPTSRLPIALAGVRSATSRCAPATAVSALVFGIAFCTALLGTPVEAPAEVSLGLATTLVEQDTPAGETNLVSVAVFNDGDVPLTVAASATDLRLDAHGRAKPIQASEEDSSWSAASWIHIDTPEFQLAPGEEMEVWVGVEPPSDAEPGTHRALVVFRGTPTVSQGDVVVRPNVALVMLAKVPGDIVEAPALGLDFPRVVFFDPAADVVLDNHGTVHYFADGTVTWSRNDEPCGECQPELPDAGALVLPDEQRLIPVSWPEAPLLGVFDARAEFTTTDGRSLSAEDRFLLIRWQLVAIVVGVLAVVGVVTYVGRRYRLVPREAGRRSRPNGPDLPDPERAPLDAAPLASVHVTVPAVDASGVPSAPS